MEEKSWTKASWEEITITFDAGNAVASTDTISSASVTIYDAAGDSASTMIDGDASISGTNILQKIKGGTDGQDYIVRLQITTTAGEKIEDTLLIKVRDVLTGTIPSALWVTTESANVFFQTRYGAQTYWTSNIDKEAALVSAQWDIENCGRFDFTASGLTDSPTTAMKTAVYEQALFLVQQAAAIDKRMGLQSQGVTTAGVIKEKYELINGIPICVRALKALTPYNKYGLGFKFDLPD